MSPGTISARAQQKKPEPIAQLVVDDVPAPATTQPAPTPPPNSMSSPAASSTTASSAAPPVATVRTVDASRARVEIGAIAPEGVTIASVQAGLQRIDFTSCYRASLGAEVAGGAGTLVIEMDEERVTRANLIGGSFSPTLRQCISQRALTARIRGVDTGSAGAKITLRFVL